MDVVLKVRVSGNVIPVAAAEDGELAVGVNVDRRRIGRRSGIAVAVA